MNIIVGFFEQLINWIYAISNDYGIAIIVITVCVRLLLIPLNIKQRKQMEKQKAISEKVAQVKDKYKDNKEKQEEAIADLYKENGISMGGCLTSVIQLPFMICLYNAIRKISAVSCGTILLPWVSSLLIKDQLFILPIATIIVQLLPQTYPYLKIFNDLKLPKQSIGVTIMMLATSCIYIFMIPSGVGLYCFVSGLFQLVEQFVYNAFCAYRLKYSLVEISEK